jgi:hypothetical protein
MALRVIPVMRVLPVRLVLRGRKANRGLLAPLVLTGLLARRVTRVIRALMVRMAVLVLTGRKVKWDQSVLPDPQGKTGP